MPLNFAVRHADGTSSSVSFEIARIANLGMAGRDYPDDEEVQQQLNAMNEAGVETPEELPFVTPKPRHLMTTSDSIQVNSAETAGEPEFVLLPTEKHLYVGVGNDHKAYDLAQRAMHTANSTCPSVVSNQVWVFDEISDHWDDVRLRSWIELDGSLESYHQASMEAFMRPEKIRSRVAESISQPVTNTAIWSGTIGSDGVDPFPEIVSGCSYIVQLYDPVVDRRLTTSYDVQINDWIHDVDIY